MHDDPPVLTAVSSSARPLFTLLRCIAFAPKAHVILSDEGLKFSVDDASVMEGASACVCACDASTLTPVPSFGLPRQVPLHHIQLQCASHAALLCRLGR